MRIHAAHPIDLLALAVFEDHAVAVELFDIGPHLHAAVADEARQLFGDGGVGLQQVVLRLAFPS